MSKSKDDILKDNISKDHTSMSSISNGSALKLVTWNVNGIRASYGKGLSEFVQNEKPDILCLQETKAHLEQVDTAVQNLGYPFAYWSSAERKGYSGVATFSTEEPLKISRNFDYLEYEKEGRIVWTQHEKFDLYNIYFPNGGSGQERHDFKQKFLKDLKQHLQFEIRKGREIILVGDYNVAHLEIDVYDPIRLSKESGFLPEEREWFAQLLKCGFIDCYRHFNPETKDVFSWWSYRELARPRNRGWRIDHICITPGLLPYLRSCEILMDQQGSDHCPVVAQFEL